MLRPVGSRCKEKWVQDCPAASFVENSPRGYWDIRDVDSVHLIADGMGWSLDKVSEKVTPVLSPRSVKTKFVTIRKGEVAGIHQVCKGLLERKEKIRLDLQMFVGAKKPRDQINIKGTPDVTMSMEKGVAGDEATVAMLLNMIPAVIEAQPGLRTLTDLPVPRFRS